MPPSFCSPPFCSLSYESYYKSDWALNHIFNMSCYTRHLAPLKQPMRVSNSVISLCFVHAGVNFSSLFLSCKHKMFLWFHFASESFHGCHYKLCFQLEQRYWKIFHYIHLWIIVQSVWCQSPFRSPSSASPSCLALFLAPSHDILALLLLLLPQPLHTLTTPSLH